MCGITGILSFNSKVEPEEVELMNQSLIHRGPDGAGVWSNEEQNLVLGHRRLSILDLSERGKQPMHSESGRYTITFNGEIYNYVELRDSLIGKGEQFKTDTDTEVLLALFSKYGEKCLAMLDGMFAFAIWDKEEKKLFCARDRFGEKPFFYFKNQNRLVFGSEMKAIFASGVPKKVNLQRLGGYLNYNLIVDQNNLESTFYENVYQLEASHYMAVDQNGRIVKKKYWSLDHVEINNGITLEQASDKFRSLLGNSINRRLRSDVAVGSSLSGGLDSSSIVRVIDSLKNKEQTQRTFSARFKDFDKDEGEYIEAVTEISNVEPYYTWPDGDGFIGELEKVFYHQEEPFQSASISAQWEVMKLARLHDTIVLLDGQGADEYLAGYHALAMPYFKELIAKDTKSFNEQHSAFEKLHNKAIPVQRTLKLRSKYPKVGGVIDKINQLRGGKYIPKDLGVNPDLIPEKSESGYLQFNQLNEALKYSMFNESLPKLLRYSDRNAMAHSVEVRLPFLNHDLVEFVMSLPSNYKINDGWTKYVLRHSMKDTLPEKITWRKDKIGYVPPQKKWMENSKVKELVDDSYNDLAKENIVTRKENGMEWKYIMSYFALNK